MQVRQVSIPVWSSAFSSDSSIFTTIGTKVSFKSSGIAVSLDDMRMKAVTHY